MLKFSYKESETLVKFDGLFVLLVFKVSQGNFRVKRNVCPPTYLKPVLLINLLRNLTKMRLNTAISRPDSSILATNKVLKNTYMLLSMTLIFSAMTAGAAMYFNFPPFGMLVTLVGFYGLFFQSRYKSRTS